jgi:hypothetical protein
MFGAQGRRVGDHLAARAHFSVRQGHPLVRGTVSVSEDCLQILFRVWGLELRVSEDCLQILFRV